MLQDEEGRKVPGKGKDEGAREASEAFGKPVHKKKNTKRGSVKAEIKPFTLSLHTFNILHGWDVILEGAL